MTVSRCVCLQENSYSNVGVPPTTRDKVRLLKASILGALDTEVALNNTLVSQLLTLPPTGSCLHSDTHAAGSLRARSLR